MAQRILVNTNHPRYQQVVRNALGFTYGLGVPTSLTDEERIQIQQQPYEIYFTSDELQYKRFKLQTILDTFTNPKFFPNQSSDLSWQRRPNEKGITYSSEFPVVISEIKKLTNVPIPDTFTGGVPWQFDKRDFPNIVGYALKEDNRRIIAGLYDDKAGPKTENITTNENITLLLREVLADALFCNRNSDIITGIAITPPEHPNPGGINIAPNWNETNKQRLYNHFQFKRIDDGRVYQNEKTYAAALNYINDYIRLINDILSLKSPGLSRSPDIEQVQLNIPLTIKLQTAVVPLFKALSGSAAQVIHEKTLTFFDETREYKTLLNLGNDRQYVAEAWRLAPKDSSSVQLKLLQPLDTDITTETPVFVSRELAQSVVDIISFELLPEADLTPYLRPFNINSKNQVSSRTFATNVTLNSLGLNTGSAGATIGNTVTYDDLVFRRWFTGDFKSSELNIDFTDYKNFVHFGSAYKRLEAFTNKLKQIEQLTSESISPGTSTSTVSALLKAKEKEEIIRKFDPYEQFLYYVTASVPYSASAFYTINETEYNLTGSWPKRADGSVHSPYSVVATNWLNTQLAIAQRYDDNNSNYLVLNLPKHIQEDINSSEFLTFFSMIGHFMDNIKTYIDQFPNIYSTNVDPLKELSMDQVYEVAQSFGLNLPNVYSLENLQSFNTQFSGESGSRSYVVETWKRFLHSMVYFGKTKGSRTSFDALLNTYGINSPILQIKETTYPSTGNFIKSDELTYALKFTGSMENVVEIPFYSSSVSASSVQISFRPTTRRASTLVTGVDSWAIDLIPHPSSSKQEYGRINVVTGPSRTVIASSSYFPLFSEDYTHIMLRSQSTDISIIQTDGDQVLFQEKKTANLLTYWDLTSIMYLGATGSMKLANNFDGIVDEIRVWGENIPDEQFEAQAYDPGSYYGATYTSSYNNLYVHIPFSQPLSSITQSVTNESPYQNIANVNNFRTKGFTTASFTRILRSIKQYTPIVGSSVYTNKKVTVAPEPVFSNQFIDKNGTKILSPISSIKKIEEKLYNSGQNIIAFSVSPTDFVNQNILRSMGVINVNNLIGSPRYLTGSTYPPLENIRKSYDRYFKKIIKPNDYIRFFKDLTEGPVEMADTMVPARGKLLNGIVIESPIIFRNREGKNTKIYADGTGTKRFDAYASGSGSTGIGAYDFSQNVSVISIPPISTGDITPITAILDMTGSFQMRSSTPRNKLSFARRVTQKVGNGTNSQAYATSSILDENSSYSTLEGVLNSETSTGSVYDGYPRNPYLGTVIIPSEDNTVTPFYDIQPRSDLNDVGTTTYFHKTTGIYAYDVISAYKKNYYVKLDTNVTSLFSRVYAKTTLLSLTSEATTPGRRVTKIPFTEYTKNSYTTGSITIDNIFSIYGLSGKSGLRLRLYRTESERTADINRPFSTTPSPVAGVLFDALLGGNNQIDTTFVFPYTLIQTRDGLLYYTVDNTTAASIQSDIVITHFTYEPAPLVPSGYLPRHYKFSRDNGIAMKRRNYIGCKEVSIIPDSTAPIVVTLSSTNDIVVNSNRTSQAATNIPKEISTIQFGGGGRLDVTGNVE